jgi:hypothetical protein
LTVALGQVPQGGACPKYPEDAVRDLAMVEPWSPCCPSLRRQEGLQPLQPLRAQVSSVHTKECTPLTNYPSKTEPGPRGRSRRALPRSSSAKPYPHQLRVDVRPEQERRVRVQRRSQRGLVRVSPGWPWRDFRQIVSRGRNHILPQAATPGGTESHQRSGLPSRLCRAIIAAAGHFFRHSLWHLSWLPSAGQSVAFPSDDDPRQDSGKHAEGQSPGTPQAQQYTPLHHCDLPAARDTFPYRLWAG